MSKKFLPIISFFLLVNQSPTIPPLKSLAMNSLFQNVDCSKQSIQALNQIIESNFFNFENFDFSGLTLKGLNFKRKSLALL